jgi:hypothetical protein
VADSFADSVRSQWFDFILGAQQRNLSEPGFNLFTRSNIGRLAQDLAPTVAIHNRITALKRGVRTDGVSDLQATVSNCIPSLYHSTVGAFRRSSACHPDLSS